MNKPKAVSSWILFSSSLKLCRAASDSWHGGRARTCSEKNWNQSPEINSTTFNHIQPHSTTCDMCNVPSKVGSKMRGHIKPYPKFPMLLYTNSSDLFQYEVQPSCLLLEPRTAQGFLCCETTRGVKVQEVSHQHATCS